MIPTSASFHDANESLVKQPVFLIEIAGYTRAFTNQATGVAGQYDWIEDIADLGITISDLDGGADQAELSFTIQDRGGLITGSFPSFVFEGKVVTLKTGFPGMDQADFALLFTGVVDHVDSANANQSYVFTCVDTRELLAEVIFATGDDGQPTDSSHPHTLNAHPLDILLNIFSTQIGLSAGQYDSARIESFRDGIYAGLQFEFALTSAPVAKDFIEQELLKPLGGYLWTNNAGKFTVNFFYHPDPTPVLTLVDADVLQIPEAIQADLIDVVTVRFDKGGASGVSSGSSGNSDTFLAEATELFSDSIAKYGQYGQTIVESQGMRSGFQGFTQAGLLARLIFLRYGAKTLKFEDLEHLWKFCTLEPGDIVAVTNQFVPDRAAGVIGITAKRFEVLDRKWSFMSGVVGLTLLDASFLSLVGSYLIAPTGEADFTAASSADQAKYMFLASDLDKYSDGTAAHALS